VFLSMWFALLISVANFTWSGSAQPTPTMRAMRRAGIVLLTLRAPPMGLRLRLEPGYDISGITGPAHAVAAGLEQYGAFIADNGSN
jgi:hypothetical protein